MKSAFEAHPDLVMLDVKLPGMDGMEVMKNIREDSWGKNVPLIIFTVIHPDDEMVKMIEKYEPSHYLVKSEWSLEKVVEKVKDVLK